MNKTLCPARFNALTLYILAGVERFPEYEDNFHAITMDAAKYNLEGCQDPACPACLSGGNIELYRALLQVAAVNDGLAPAETLEGLDLLPLVVPEIVKELIANPESPRARNLASLLEAKEIDKGFDYLNLFRGVLEAEAVALAARDREAREGEPC